VEDPEDNEAIITINADSQAFYVLNQGKDIVRTREQRKKEKEREKETKEVKKKEK